MKNPMGCYDVSRYPSREAMVDGFAAAMARLIAEPRLRNELGTKGRERVEQQFDWEKKIDRTLEIYRALLPALESAEVALSKR